MRTLHLLVLVGLGACAPEAGARVATTAAPLVMSPSGVTPAVATALVDHAEVVAERAAKLAAAPSVLTLVPTLFDTPVKLDEAALEAIAALGVVASDAPMLVPRDLATWESVTHVGAADWRTLTFHGGGVMVVLTGRTTVVERPAINAELDGLSMYGLHQVVDGIRTVTFERYGLPWSLDVECAQAGDARCVEPAYADALVASLVRVGEAN